MTVPDGPVRGVVERFISLTVRRRFWAPDAIELHVDARSAYATEIAFGRVLYLPLIDFDTPLAFLVEQIEYDETSAQAEMIVSGRTLDGLALNDRIIVPPAGESHDEVLVVAPETAMRHFVTSQAISPENPARHVPGLAVATDSLRPTGVTINASGRFGRVGDAIYEIGVVNGLGWEVRYDASSGVHTFTVLEGTDRSDSVIFDLELGTLEEWSEVASLLDSYTAVYAAGQGEGVERDVVLSVETSPYETRGLDRREAFVDARDITFGELALLTRRADAARSANESEASLTVKPRVSGQFTYGIDWHLGDLVQIRNRNRGISRVARIVGVDFAVTESAAVPELSIVLDRPVPTLRDRTEGRIASGKTADVAGPVETIVGALAFTGIATSTLTGTQNNVALDAGAETIRWTGGSNARFTGLSSGTEGRQVTLENASTSAILRLAHQDTGSSAGNRFIAPLGTAFLLLPGATCVLRYDSTITRWRVIGHRTAPGLIFPFGGATAPAGTLLCDGTSYLRADYPDLFGVVGTTFGAADATHFNVPDLRQRFPLGVAASGTGNALGATGGSIDHSHTLGTHTHTTSGHSHSVSSHSHTMSGHTHSVSGHTHTMTGHTHTGPSAHASHTHTGSSTHADHTHTGPSHQHALGFDVQTSTINFHTSYGTTSGNGRRKTVSASDLTGSANVELSGSAGTGATGVESSNLTHDSTGSESASLTHGSTGTATDTMSSAGSGSTGSTADSVGSGGGGSTGSATDSTSSSGGGTSSTTNPPFLAVNFVIQT